MPVDRRLYPPDWKDIAHSAKIRAGWKCELCGAEHGKPNPRTGSKVVLTVHHLDFDPSCADPNDLIVVCQRCHLRLDKGNHARHRRENRELEKYRRLVDYLYRHGMIVSAPEAVYREIARLLKED